MGARYVIAIEIGNPARAEPVEFSIATEDGSPVAINGAGFHGLEATLRTIALIIGDHAASERLVEGVRSGLTDREREVLDMAFGLDGVVENPATQEQIADAERRALTKLKGTKE